MRSGSPHAVAGRQRSEREWVAKRKRRFSLSEMFDTHRARGRRFRPEALAADAGIEAERMERYLERAATQQKYHNSCNVSTAMP
jgi:hypothetical protein